MTGGLPSILHDKENADFRVIKRIHVQLYGPLKALILDYLAFRVNGKRIGLHDRESLDGREHWVRESIERIEDGIYGIYSKTSIRNALKELERDRYIRSRRVDEVGATTEYLIDHDRINREVKSTSVEGRQPNQQPLKRRGWEAMMASCSQTLAGTNDGDGSDSKTGDGDLGNFSEPAVRNFGNEPVRNFGNEPGFFVSKIGNASLKKEESKERTPEVSAPASDVTLPSSEKAATGFTLPTELNVKLQAPLPPTPIAPAPSPTAHGDTPHSDTDNSEYKYDLVFDPSDIDPDTDVLDWLKYRYRLARGAKLPNLAARAYLHIPHRVRELEEAYGPDEFRRTVLYFLSRDEDWLKASKWDIGKLIGDGFRKWHASAMEKTCVLAALPEVPADARTAPARPAATQARVLAIEDYAADWDAAVRNRGIIPVSYLTRWIPSVDRTQEHSRIANQVEFIAAWPEVLSKSMDLIARCSPDWLNFRWLFRQKDGVYNWRHVQTGKYDWMLKKNGGSSLKMTDDQIAAMFAEDN